MESLRTSMQNLLASSSRETLGLAERCVLRHVAAPRRTLAYNARLARENAARIVSNHVAKGGRASRVDWFAKPIDVNDNQIRLGLLDTNSSEI